MPIVTALTSQKEVTIRDVAARAGVAISTVSKVYGRNATPIRISEDTIRRVRQAGSELNYSPNAAARAMRRGRTQNIGLLIGDEVFASMATRANDAHRLNCVEAALAARRYNLLLIRHRPDDPDMMLDPLASRGVDGLIVLAIHDPRVLELCRQRSIPVVDLIGTPGPATVCTVEAGLVAARQGAMRYALRMGHRRVGYAFPENPRDRYLAEALIQRIAHDTDLTPCQITPIALPAGAAGVQAQGRALLDGWLAAAPAERPTLLMAHEEVLLGFLTACSEIGVQCPRDLSLIALSQGPMSPYIKPRLTAIDNDVKGVCNAGVDLLLKSIDSGQLLTPEDSPPPRPCRLVEGDSCIPTDNPSI